MKHRQGHGALTLLRSALQILYPEVCLCCGEELLFSGSLEFPICTSCRESLSPIRSDRRCPVCSIPLISETRRCTRCSQREFSFDSNFSLFEYRGEVRRIIAAFKFHNHRCVGRFIASLLLPELQRLHRGAAVVPVPGSRQSVRRRGWDPMLVVAGVLDRSAGLPVIPLLERRRSGAQKGLRVQDRKENIRGATELRRVGGAGGTSREDVPRRVVLIDDIFTSGATADECSRVLRRGGARTVDVLTLAIEV